MDSRQRAMATLGLGVVLVAAPTYVESAFAVGLGAILDPVAAVGLLPAGAYPLAVGTGYLVAGTLSLLFAGAEPLAYRSVTIAGLLAAVIALFAASGLVVAETGVPVGFEGLPTVAYLLAAAAVPAAFVVGLGTGPGRHLPALALVGALLLPVLSLVGIRLRAGSELAAGAMVFAAGAVLVFGLFWAYPLYRLGRSFEVVVR